MAGSSQATPTRLAGLGHYIGEKLRAAPSSAWALFAVLGLVFGVVGLLGPAPPLQDISEWLHQGRVAAQIVRGSADPAFVIAPYPVPNTLVPAFFGLAMLVFSARTAFLLWLSGYLLLAAWLIPRFVRRWNVEPWCGTGVLAGCTALTSCFWNGYASYQTGLLLLLWFFGLPERSWRIAIVLVGSTLAAYLLHGLCYLPLLLIAAVHGLWSGYLRRVILCALPSLGLLACYAFAHPPLPGTTMPGSAFLAYKAYTLAKSGPFQNFVLLQGPAVRGMAAAAGVGANGLFALGLTLGGAVALWRSGRRGWATPKPWAGALLLVGFLVSPAMGGGIVNPGERLLSPALLCFLPLLNRDVLAPTARRAAAVCGGGLLILCTVAPLTLGLQIASTPPDRLLSPGPPGVAAALATVKGPESLFTHRPYQFRADFEEAESGARGACQVHRPLIFDTGVVLMRRPPAPALACAGRRRSPP